MAAAVLTLLVVVAGAATALGLQDAAPSTEDRVVGIVVISEGRSGSTMLMRSLLSAVQEESFVIPEPYYWWRSEQLMNAPDTPPAPTIEQLLDCSYIQDKAVFGKVTWAYACYHMGYFRETPGAKQRCLQRRMVQEDRNSIERQCLSAKYRFIKTIRYRRFPRIGLDEQQIDRLQQHMHLRLLHLIRRPWATMSSQFLHGWNNRAPTEEEVIKYTYNMCSRIASVMSHLSELDNIVRTFVLVYERFIENRDASTDILDQLLPFLLIGQSAQEPILDAMYSSKYSRLGKRPGKAERAAVLEKAIKNGRELAVAREHVTCRALYLRYWPKELAELESQYGAVLSALTSRTHSGASQSSHADVLARLEQRADIVLDDDQQDDD